MGYFIFGVILGFVFSDVITNRWPQTIQFKIPPEALVNLFPEPKTPPPMQKY